MKAGIDDEGGKIFRHRDGLAHPLGKRADLLIGLFVRTEAADDFHQVHHRNRIHEMHADETFGPVRRCGQPCNRNRRGVGRDYRIVAQIRDQRFEDLDLDGLVLGRGFDHDVAIFEDTIFRTGFDAPERRCPVGFADDRAFYLAVYVAVDISDRRFQGVCVYVEQYDVETGQSADMRDTVAHLARANDANIFDHVSVRSCIRPW